MKFSGSKLRELRMQLDLTQEELAKIVGVSRNSINAIECGRSAPSIFAYMNLFTLFHDRIPNFKESDLFTTEV